ncbi:hypothetical protein CR513_33779, partial [Mucuna pruriens]
MKGVINPPKVVEEEEVETILVEQMKGGMINLMFNVIIAISMGRTNVEEKTNLVGEKEEGEESTLLLALNEEISYKEKFVKLKEKVKGNVSFDDSSKVQIQGKDTILISLKDGYHKFIKDVYYVHKLRSSILSLGQLVEKRYEILMKENFLCLKNQISNLVAKTNEAKCLKASIKDEAWF